MNNKKIKEYYDITIKHEYSEEKQLIATVYSEFWAKMISNFVENVLKTIEDYSTPIGTISERVKLNKDKTNGKKTKKVDSRRN